MAMTIPFSVYNLGPGLDVIKNITFSIVLLLLLIYSEASNADLPIVLTNDTRTVVNLMDTDLVKKKDLLDCLLRLEGKPPHYKLIYSLGEIEVPTLTVKKKYDDSHLLLAVRAKISGLPISELFVRYHEGTNPYKMELNCPMEKMPCDAPVAYTVLLDRSENTVLSTLRSRYANDLIIDSTMSEDVNPGAVMMRDRAGLITYAMDGLGGSDNKHKTYLHYVCATK